MRQMVNGYVEFASDLITQGDDSIPGRCYSGELERAHHSVERSAYASSVSRWVVSDGAELIGTCF